ncbi:MAG: HAD hydrolase-like protein [Clostridia bacterium]|nr:HAD hydrolase-like protein [Clostridia bacterium]
MSKFDAVLFDFDGTVADTSPGIKSTLLYVFEKNNMERLDSGQMDKFIGPPLTDSFMNYCGKSYDEALRLQGDFRARYRVEGVNMFEIYPGFEDALKVLKKKGVVIAIATSKPETMAVHILKKAGLYGYFDVILGATVDESLTRKDDIMRIVLENPMIKGKSAVMVGDTKLDIMGAHKNGIAALWVKYGFGIKKEAEEQRPEYTAENVEEMIRFFEDM